MILGLIDHDRGALDGASLEMLTLARGLAEATGEVVAAALIGSTARPLADQLAAYGVSSLFLAVHDGLDDYAPEAWAESIVELVQTHETAAIVAPGTDRGHEVLAHVAARLDLPMAANCTAVRPGDEGYEVTRIRWGGSLLEEALLTGDPLLFTVAPHMVVAEESPVSAALTVHEFTPSLSDKAFRVRVVGRSQPESDKISLGEARVVVGGGRGVGSAEGFALLDELAALLGGAVGGSRVATNLGWRPHADQIGQTGTRIAPDLYIACGISGAIQHWVGCKGAKQILAINTDPEAPMVTKASHAVIGNLHEVLPALITAIRASQG